MSFRDEKRRERRFEAARGYLLLEMPEHALRELAGIEDPEECWFEIEQLRGEALREQQDYDSALEAFQRADALHPNDLTVLFGMAWCHKRTDRLDKAIESMERAYQVEPGEPVVLYNLACYFSLAGDKEQSLSWLGRAIRMEQSLRKLISGEPDFDPLRDDPDFRLIADLSVERKTP
jgi:tetratricopeptide (TPR) repeat protein